MSNKITNNEIERLAQICRKEETNLLIRKRELSLNESVLQFVSNTHNNDIKVNYLRQLFRKIPSIKLIGDQLVNKSSDESLIYLMPFSSCVCLQLIRIAFKRLVGLETIRLQLKSLKCFKCFETQVLDEEFWHLFGVWPQLSSLNLSQNNIISLNASIIPSSVQILDLSWNRIQTFNNITDYSVNCLSKLVLSYNCLKEVPKLNDTTCATLKSLFIRGNLIENIEGIEKLTKLIELDIAINCICDLNSLISRLKRCKSLKTLWIDGNPIAFDPNTNQIIQKELTSLTQLNSNPINKDLNSLKERTTHSSNEGKIFSSRAEEEGEDLFFDASCDSMDLSTSSVGKNGLNKKKKLRVVEIKDQIEVCEQFEKIDIKSNESNDRRDENSSEAKELIQKRKEFGDDWLVSIGPSVENSSFFDKIYANSDSSSTLNASISQPMAESTPKCDRKISTISRMTNDDDIEILANEDNTDWSRNETESDTNIVIAKNPETNETFFVYVREEDGMIFEKDCNDGKVLRTHDLKVLTNVEIINDLVLKIYFETRVSSRREVKYQFDCNETCLEFNDKFIIPWISDRKHQLTYEEVLFECLKCGQNKLSSIPIKNCSNCGSDAIMKSENNRKRRSGSDITILSQMNAQNNTEIKSDFVDEINVWEELFSINSSYDNSFFTRVEHSLKLYIEVKLFTEEEEVIEGLVKCKAMSGQQNRLESAFLVISNKNILILTINENENYDNFDAYLKINISKPISSLMQMKEFPNLLTNQGFWLQFRDDDKQSETKSRSLINRFGSKRSQYSEPKCVYCLVVFSDEIIGKLFIQYFNQTIDSFIKVANIPNKTQNIVIIENSIPINDEMIVLNAINFANYKRNDMKSELKLSENMVIIVTEKLVILGELYFDANNDYKIKVLYKELITNLLRQICVNLQNKSFRLSFTDITDSIETQFTINLFTTDSIKKILIPIKSQWEQEYEVPLSLLKF